MSIPEARPDEMVDILAGIGRGERLQHFETVRVRKDGTRVPVALAVWPLKDGMAA